MSTGVDLAKTMLAHVGKVHYVWGGTTWAGGVDCSGAIYRSLHDLGNNVPRYTAQEFLDVAVSEGEEISVAEAEKITGSLLYIGPRHGIHHVAVSLGGPVNHPSDVEAANPTLGMIVGGVANRFTYASLCPTLTYGVTPPPPPSGTDWAAVRRLAAADLSEQLGKVAVPIEASTVPGPPIKTLQQSLNLQYPAANIPLTSVYDPPTQYLVALFENQVNMLKPGTIHVTPGDFSFGNSCKFMLIVALDRIAQGLA